jgi:hypothetical protein
MSDDRVAEALDNTEGRHWLIVWDDDGEPYGELCWCEIGEDHESAQPL